MVEERIELKSFTRGLAITNFPAFKISLLALLNEIALLFFRPDISSILGFWHNLIGRFLEVLFRVSKTLGNGQTIA